MDLHEELLAYSGGRWDKPPARLIWSDEHRAKRDEIIRSYGDAAVWGFKCPRTLVTLDFWQEAIPRLSLVGTFRHPLLVAKSLSARNGGDLGEWLSLWRTYNQRLVDLYDTEPFPVVRFDTDSETYRRSLDAVITRLDFRPASALTFFEPVLRHRHHVEPPATDVPPEVARLYARLCEISMSSSATERPHSNPSQPESKEPEQHDRRGNGSPESQFRGND
jgi:hypothetical protein